MTFVGVFGPARLEICRKLGWHQPGVVRTLHDCKRYREGYSVLCPIAWSFSTWPQVVIALPNASRSFLPAMIFVQDTHMA